MLSRRGHVDISRLPLAHRLNSPSARFEGWEARAVEKTAAFRIILVATRLRDAPQPLIDLEHP